MEDLARQVDALHDQGLAAGGNTPHLGGEMFEAAWRLRGLDNFLVDLVERQDMAAYLLDRLAELAAYNAATLARAGIDVLSLDDDVGMPVTMMIGPAHLARVPQAAPGRCHRGGAGRAAGPAHHLSQRRLLRAHPR